MKTKKTTSAPRLHSILSPSSSHRWLGDGGEGGCGASIRHIGLFQQEENASMSEGTLAHSRLELLLKGMRKSLRAFDAREKPSREMIEGTDGAADYFMGLVEKGGSYTAEEHFAIPQIAFNGTLDGEAIKDPGQGHADFCADNPDWWDVGDFKYGYGAVEVEENPQLLLYALRCFKKKRKPCRLHVVQPRASHQDGPCRTWTALVAYMAAFERKVLAQVKAINAGTAPFNPSGPVCKYCPKKDSCQAFQEKALAVVNRDFSEFMNAPATPTIAYNMSDKQIANAWVNWPLVEQFRETLERLMLTRLKQGAKLPAKLVRGTTHPVWVDEEDAAQILLANGVRKSVVFPRSVITPSQARKALKSKADVLDDVIVYPQGPIQIAPLSDKRKPLKFKGK